MSFIKTIFPASKRRKTDSSTFVYKLRFIFAFSEVFFLCSTTSERELRPDMLRMVLIEAEQRVLFDTASIVPIGCRILPANAQLSACKKFQLLKRRRDISTISQMLFGAMPTAIGSDSFKIHTITYVMIIWNSLKSVEIYVSSVKTSDSWPPSWTGNYVERCRKELSFPGSEITSLNVVEMFFFFFFFFFFEKKVNAYYLQHIPLVEAEMSRLEMRITSAAANSTTFFINVNKAWQDFCSSICQLHNAPRLRHPVWLSLLERDHNENVVVADFCRQLTRLVEKLDTKHTKFFLSNLISTVLMHHMSWVASVAPPLHAPTHLHEKNQLVGSPLSQIFNDEAPYMPYNAQIAQYLEISGSVGSVHRMAKTVVSGFDSDLITSILQVLSYFIRCSAIHQKG
ncbi:unnamed protein product [Haemonchus placei]|uniref:FNIP_M domain-containing protein n=1 Tax=Haemonchus placei TaxID=6290 RepID=A0A158QKY0_HAEPC|nr:unnamed protein product [Haemonchus placei]